MMITREKVEDVFFIKDGNVGQSKRVWLHSG